MKKAKVKMARVFVWDKNSAPYSPFLIFFSLSLVFCTLFTVSSCQNIIQPNTGAIEAGKGVLIISANGSGMARTIIPSTVQQDFVQYKLDFVAQTSGNTSFSKTWTAMSGSVTLDSGTWELTVTAYLPSGEGGQPLAAASGTLPSFSISLGSSVTKDVTLLPIEQGEGTFGWDIDFESGYQNARMEIWSADTISGTTDGTGTLLKTVNLVTNQSKSNLKSQTTLEAGVYLVVFVLSNGQEQVSISEALHIYQNMESDYTNVFTAKYFPTTLLSCILNAYDATAKVWNLNAAGIVASDFSYLGINGVNDSNYTAMIGQFNTLCLSSGAPSDLGGLKILVDTARICIANADANFLNAGNYGYQGDAEAAVRALVTNGTPLSLAWKADNKTLTVQIASYTADFVFSAVLSSAPQMPPTEGLTYTLINNNTAYSVSAPMGAPAGQGNIDSFIVIPNIYGGLPVTAIADNGFMGFQNIVSVTIPSSVTSIGNSAFLGCSSLTSITIPDSVTSIGNSAFLGCSSLTSITIPDSVTSIGVDAFSSCNGLMSIVVESGNTVYRSEGNCLIRIADDALIAGCNNSVIPTTGVTSIGNSAFSGCSSLTSITIPTGVTSIGDAAFSSCSGLTSIAIPDSVMSIGNYAFENCSRLMSITIPDHITNINDWLFYGCSALTDVTIPNSVMSIGDGAFYDCHGLLSITIPDSVTSISSEAFYYCSSLTSITIPDSVTSIGSEAFSYCNVLTNITVEGGNTVYRSEGNCLIQIVGNMLIAGCNNSVIPDSVTSIGNDAFLGCQSLASIMIPDSVASIGNYAFTDCRNATSLAIPDSITSIGYNAFSNCNKLVIVFYGGADRAAWNGITIGSSNDPLTSAKIYYYSETNPSVANSYWHWQDGIVGGTPVVW